MRSIEDKGCYNHGPIQEISSTTFEFHKGNRNSHHRTVLGKPTPSKWDDAQKWLVGLSKNDKNTNSQPRNSNADDRRLIAPVPHQEPDFSSGEEENGGILGSMETKKVDCTGSSVRPVCVRDIGTEMTPIASQEPSRTATPIRARTPVSRSPISSGTSTPIRCQHRPQCHGEELNGSEIPENKNLEESKIPSPLETRAMAWDEAERAKYMARYKREEVKIQAWENHEKRKAEMEMKKLEVKAERMKARAEEKLASKLASTRRIAEEKRANAEAKLNEKAVKSAERADYIRRKGHLPSSFSFKLPSICW